MQLCQCKLARFHWIKTLLLTPLTGQAQPTPGGPSAGAAGWRQSTRGAGSRPPPPPRRGASAPPRSPPRRRPCAAARSTPRRRRPAPRCTCRGEADMGLKACFPCGGGGRDAAPRGPNTSGVPPPEDLARRSIRKSGRSSSGGRKGNKCIGLGVDLPPGRNAFGVYNPPVPRSQKRLGSGLCDKTELVVICTPPSSPRCT